MEDQTPPLQTQIDPDGLVTFYTEYGRLAFVAHQHEAKLAKLRGVGQQLLAEHAPGKCQPVTAPSPEDAPSDEAPGG